MEIRRLIEERRSTPKEEKQRLKEVSKCIKKCIREKKDWKDNKTSKEFSKTSKVSATSQESNLAKKKVLIAKIKNEKGEIITSRKGIGEFYKRLYEDKEKDDSEHEVNDDGNYSNDTEDDNNSSTDVHNNNTEETAGIPEITTEELQTAINKLKKKGKSPTTKEFEPKTL